MITGLETIVNLLAGVDEEGLRDTGQSSKKGMLVAQPLRRLAGKPISPHKEIYHEFNTTDRRRQAVPS